MVFGCNALAQAVKADPVAGALPVFHRGKDAARKHQMCMRFVRSTRHPLHSYLGCSLVGTPCRWCRASDRLAGVSGISRNRLCGCRFSVPPPATGWFARGRSRLAGGGSIGGPNFGPQQGGAKYGGRAATCPHATPCSRKSQVLSVSVRRKQQATRPVPPPVIGFHRAHHVHG